MIFNIASTLREEFSKRLLIPKYLPINIKQQCFVIAVINHNFSYDRFYEIKQWLINNIGAEFEIKHIPQTLNNNYVDEWAIESFSTSGEDKTLVCWIANADKRTEFALIWE